MAAEQKTQMVDANALASAMAAAIQSIAPKPEIKEGDPEYTTRLEQEGFMDLFDGGVKVYQNAYEAQPRGLSAEVRHRAAHLKPGKYFKGRVTVEVDGQGVHLKYPVKGDALLINQSHWSDFSDLINKIWDEAHAVAA